MKINDTFCTATLVLTSLFSILFTVEQKNTAESVILEDLKLKKIDRSVSFTVILNPDLFMTSDSLEKDLKSILIKFKYAKIIIIGPIGSTYTLWPKSTVLTPALHSTSLSKLLIHLYSEKRFFNECSTNYPETPGIPLFFFGFGTGVYSLLLFLCSDYLNMPWLSARSVTVCAVNGVFTLRR